MHQLCVCHFVVFLLLISLLTVNKQHLVSLSLSWLVGSILIFLGDWKMTFFLELEDPGVMFLSNKARAFLQNATGNL